MLTDIDDERAEVLSNFFASVFTDEPPGNWEISPPPTASTDDNLELTINDIREELNRLDTSKLPGTDGVHPRVLFELREINLKPLLIIFQTSWETNKLPEDWNLANISAIFKKGKKSMADNYRPISLISICCRLFEKFVRKHLMDHFNEEVLIINAQYCFPSGRSLNLQVLKVIDEFTRAMDKHEIVDVIYLDFKKVFDSVPHKRLIGVLKQYGVIGRTLNWITDFLSRGQQRVVINDSISSWQPVKSGIPQSSVLGPVLFLIYINTMPDKITSKIYLFADDAKLYRQIEDKLDVKRIHEDLQSLDTLSGQSLLSFNIDNCVHMRIGTKKVDMERNYKINGENIQGVQLEKYLGIWLDNKLTLENTSLKKPIRQTAL